MAMKLLKKVRDLTNLKNYGIHKKIVEMGCDITLTGLGGYDSETARSLRTDVLTCLERLCCEEHDLPKETFWSWVSAEGKRFLNK